MIPQGVIEVRIELCNLCAAKAHDPCAACEHGHWGQYESTGCEGGSSSPTGTPKPALGDRIASVAQPIARTIDRVLGTNVANCGGCNKMKAELNAGIAIPRAIKNRVKRSLL